MKLSLLIWPAVWLPFAIWLQACCSGQQTRHFEEPEDIRPYVFFGDGSFWEFEDSLGNRRRIDIGSFRRSLVYTPSQTCRDGLFGCCDGGDTYLLSTSAGASLDSGFTIRWDLFPHMYLEFSGRDTVDFGGRLFLYKAPQTPGSTNLIDSAVTLRVEGETMDSVRHYQVEYQYRTSNDPSRILRGFLDLYLAPNVGPVLARFERGKEWRLVNHLAVKPEL